MATNKFSGSDLNPAPQVPHTGIPEIDDYLNLPIEVHRYGDHVVEIGRDPVTHIALTEEWRTKDGKLDRADGPAVIRRDRETGAVCTEEWWKNDLPHRSDAPAMIYRDPKTGVATFEGWYNDGMLTRDNAPAWIVRDEKSGSVIFQSWAKNGVSMDDSLPSPLAVLLPKRPRPDASPQGDDPAP